ncbi:MAG: type IV pilus biogenesis/stability protein PilW [Burkholderiales bacterium]
MKSLRAAALFTTMTLAACATPPVSPEIKPATSTTGAETDQQLRARIHTELASGYYELGNMGVALEEVREALRADPDYGPAYNVAALVYADLKEDRLAQQSFERALRINPLDSDANNNYGLFLCRRQREEEAIKYFLAALRNPLYRNPDRSYVNAAVCSRRRGDIAAARDYLQKALELRPNQPQALYQLADIEYQRGNFAEAKGYLHRLPQAAIGPEALWLGVRAARGLGDRDAEASYALQLRKNFPDSREARALAAGRYE